MHLSPIKDTAKVWFYRSMGLTATTERHLDFYLSRRMYRRVFGREPDLVNPTLFSEKVTARKLFERRPIFTTINDKVLVRDFVAERIGPQYLSKLHFTGERFEDIDFDRLPDEFVIKANHGCHWLALVEDKKTFDREKARRRFRRWLRDSYYLYSRERMYKDIRRKIIVEEYLRESSGAPATDYKLFVYDGVVHFLRVSAGERDGDRNFDFFDSTGRHLRVAGISPRNRGHPPPAAKAVEFPANFEELSQIAGKLAQGFDFMRVDLYSPKGRILFGEMTPLPTGGVIAYDPPEFDRILGAPWRLSLNGA
jgi:hypothetical protein